MALALARKYRPRSFADLVGQETVSQTLAQALDGDRLSHAYLFSGLRGSGKTSTARIFAKALLCEKGPTSQPCEECPHCIMANEYRHMDIIEMDAASNRGIDDIKELIEHTKYKPGSGRFKIFIIDEVHMLTTQAFNALLKTLEEPPEFVKFILATTDPLKLPATILSRTQHFRFKKIPPRLVKSHLEHILHLEGIDYEPEALEIIARSGAGSLRDSLTLLDQAIVYAKGKVDLPTVTEMLGIIDPAKLDDLLDRILNKDEAGILAFIHESSEYETEMIIDELTLHLKDLLFAKDPRFPPLILDRFFRILAEAKELLFLGSDGEFVLSLTLFKMMEALSIKEIDEMIRTLQKELSGVQSTPAPTTSAPTTAAAAESRKQPAPAAESPASQSTLPQASAEATPPKSAPAEEPRPAETPSPATEAPAAPASGTAPDAGALKFKALLEKLYDRDYDLGETFERCIRYQSFDGASLTWESTAQGADKKRLVTYWGIIRMFVQEIFGLDVKILNIAKEADKAPEEDKKKVKTPAAEERPAAVIKEEPPASGPEQEECALPDNAQTASTLEAVELPSSCMNPDTGSSEASKEIDPKELLKEPMVKEAIALFDPKRVRIKRKS
ncbi:DNA polymerase III subunit gamma/tau [Nitratifractor salsuginis]|uniref:DNA polymerase III subunit gamma/tau n=1 Tax=Nitratifractor salsuginis (strain DSM 16511 / JCM 12458 / E9I37-1) TaxID=749222 RepID=E6WZF5_NITSE|nr:DNA polymerase III, subunits gamma and tau [Nitratifractor salsuginis DSM 16511]